MAETKEAANEEQTEVHQVFAPMLKALGGDYVTDDRGRLCHAPQPFDENDDDLMHDLLGNKRLAEPVQALLIALSQIDATRDSFGLNAERTVACLLPKLRALRQACYEEWRDEQ